VQVPINDDFNIGSFWRIHESDLPAFSYVLRAVLANPPNSAPPERVFSILNDDTFGDDQMQACADYIEPRGAWAFVLTVLKFRRRRSSTFLPPRESAYEAEYLSILRAVTLL